MCKIDGHALLLGKKGKATFSNLCKIDKGSESTGDGLHFSLDIAYGNK